jgi:hypothetical protein
MATENPIKAVLKEQASAAAATEIVLDKIPEQLTRSTSIPILDRTMGGWTTFRFSSLYQRRPEING